MTDEANTPKIAKADAIAAKAKAKALRPWYQKKRFIIPGALAVVIAFSSASNGGNPGTQLPNSGESPSSGEIGTDSPVEESYANETAAQQNARESAESYLNSSAFSRSGLISQLEYEQYDLKDAEYAVDVLNVDWNDQAAKSAVRYLESSAFSESGLIGQLKYEGFSKKQATYGVSVSGADWNEQAAKSAESYLNSGSFSRGSLIDQLIYEGFSKSQATFGVTEAGL
jgi:hypothetical protein